MSAWHCGHSQYQVQASVGMVSSLEKPHLGQVMVDCRVISKEMILSNDQIEAPPDEGEGDSQHTGEQGQGLPLDDLAQDQHLWKG